MKLNEFSNLKIDLPPLPFDKKSLVPFMSEETIHYHYEKHHKAYVDKVKSLITQENIFLLDLIKKTKEKEPVLYNNSAQILNHHIFWLCLKKGVKPNEKEFIEKHFESFSNFKTEFVNKGLSTFGSGWVWVLKLNEKVYITTSSNGNIPEEVLNESAFILTLCDVWEHAYYIDHRNDRKAFLENFVENCMKIHI